MASLELGPVISEGRTSTVYECGADSVVKVPSAGVPADWARFEADLCRAVYAAGLPVPEVRDLVRVDDRDAIVFERVHGPSLWQCMLAETSTIPDQARRLASIQRELLSAGIPPGIPDFVDRLERRIEGAEPLDDADRDRARSLANALPRGAALLHGDLHPGNVLMGDRGPVVIDWFDAAIGHPVADVVRSSMLLGPHGPVGPVHLPGATDELLAPLHRAYLGDFDDLLSGEEGRLDAWRAVVAVGRLAERADRDPTRLLSLWDARPDPLPAVGHTSV
ncbi:MAG: phosphotransferase [Actinomycetota bacterium]